MLRLLLSPPMPRMMELSNYDQSCSGQGINDRLSTHIWDDKGESAALGSAIESDRAAAVRVGTTAADSRLARRNT